MIPTWQDQAKKDPDWNSGMITNQMIQEKMQEEIDALRKELALQRLSDIGQTIQLYTHPVKCNKCNDTEWVCENHPDQEAHKCIYCGGAGKPCECTHPVKELTDEEIKLEAKYLCHGWHSENPERLVLFARAILRKAQEK